MARHVWSVICDRVLVDPETDNLSLMDVVSAVALEGMPPMQVGLRLTLVSSWVRSVLNEPERALTRLRIESPTGAPLDAMVGEVQIELHGDGRTHTVSRVNRMMTLHEEGIYQFVVEHRKEEEQDWTPATRIPVEVWFEPPLEPTGETPGSQTAGG